MTNFRRELESLLNGYNKERNSNTPDFVLAQYIERCLDAYDEATRARDAWYSVHLCPGASYFKKESQS